MRELPQALAPMAAYRQFLLWQMRDGRKMPINPNTLQAYPKESNWQQAPDAYCTDAVTACSLAEIAGPDYGVGFLFTPADPFFFVDIDKCLNPDGQSWSPVAMDIMGRLPGAAIEVSQSGTGLHIFGTGAIAEHACKNVPLGLELYTESRFVALTGTNAIGSAGTDFSAALPSFVASYFPPKKAGTIEDWTTEPVPGWKGPEDDAALIEKMLSSGSTASKFGASGGVAALWAGDTSAYNGDGSSADAALAQHLAFWTGSNCERMLRLMWQSALVRDKWDRDDYLSRTIMHAVGKQTEWFSVREELPPVEFVESPNLSITTEPQLVDGYMFLGAPQQLEWFKGCVYVQDLHRAFCPNGTLLKPDQFRATYGGAVFQLAAGDNGKTTKNAWEAFTESQAVRFPKAESGCFRPDLAPGAIMHEAGRVLVNTYVPLATERKRGDVGPFLAHLEKLLPIERDRQILLAYLAACIQHKGVKFQWAPLIQGAEGNGKTLFSRCVAFAIGRRYSHWPKAADIDNKFNSWLQNKLFIAVEDIFVAENRREILEALKPMITGGDGIEIQHKGADQVTVDICCNFILNSNHKDAIRKTRNDRRYAPFFTAQQTADDVAKAGMGGDYFPKLYNWLRAGGFAYVHEYLATYAIPDELNPAGACHRAPDTSSTLEAVAASMGGIEQEILEAVDEGRPGFAGGWISSAHLEILLKSMRAERSIPPNKRRELMQALGYDWHPALNAGRVNNPIPMDGGKKSRLFIRSGHIHSNLSSPAEVARHYQEAQGSIPSAAGEAFGNVQ